MSVAGVPDDRLLPQPLQVVQVLLHRCHVTLLLVPADPVQFAVDHADAGQLGLAGLRRWGQRAGREVERNRDHRDLQSSSPERDVEREELPQHVVRGTHQRDAGDVVLDTLLGDPVGLVGRVERVRLRVDVLGPREAEAVDEFLGGHLEGAEVVHVAAGDDQVVRGAALPRVERVGDAVVLAQSLRDEEGVALVDRPRQSQGVGQQRFERHTIGGGARNSDVGFGCGHNRLLWSCSANPRTRRPKIILILYYR